MIPARAGGSATASFRPHEIALAVALAVVIEALAVLGLRAARESRAAPAAPPEPSEAVIPVRAVAIEDPAAPLLKLGGGAPRAMKSIKPRNEEARPSRASKKAAPSDIDRAEEALNTSATDEEPAAPSEAEGDSNEGAEAEAPADLPPGPGGEGHPDGSPEGTEADPLKARAIDLYRARIIAWFSARFRVSGSGLPSAELERLRVSASVTISSDRRVVSYSMAPSGSAPFDAAARAALEGSVGSTIPAPPESYPDIVQTSIHVTFVCRRNQCD